MTMRDQTAVVGVGATPYYKRGQSVPETQLSMACTAILGALEDAGLTINDLDGFTIYSNAVDPAQVAAVLGVPEVRFAATLTSGGGGIGRVARLGGGRHPRRDGRRVRHRHDPPADHPSARWYGRRRRRACMGAAAGAATLTAAAAWPPSVAFTAGSGLISPGHSFSILTRRHMHLYGTTRDHLAEVAITQRDYAITRPTSIQRLPLTREDYFNARMISDPLCLFDYTMETDGAVAAVVTSADRARDLRHPPVYIMASANGGMGRWGPAIFSFFQQPDEYFASSGHRPVARRMYEMAGITPDDVDVALLYDHFSPMV